MSRALTLVDRINALSRSKQYKQDFEKYRQYCSDASVKDQYLIDWLCPTPLTNLSEAAQYLCKKYVLPFPIDPEGTIISLPDEAYTPIENSVEWPAATPLPLEKDNLVFGLINGKYLNVMLDMERTESEIIQDIKRLYGFYSTQVKEDQRQRSTTQDPWDIYDQIEVQGKTQLKIAKEIVGTNENPAYNSQVDAIYKQVKKAYRRAKDILRIFEK